MSDAKMLDYMKELLACDYPFQWQPKIELESVPDHMTDRLIDKLNEKIFDVDFHFELLMLYIGLSYEYAIDNRIEEAVKTMETVEKQMKESTWNIPSHVYEAVQHVVLATRAYLMLMKKNFDVAAKVISEIPPIDSMNIENRAAIYGLRAVFFDEYGISGTRRALELSSKAIDLNPNQSLWYFLKGKYIGRLRRVERPYDVPQKEEIEMLENALRDRENATYIIFTAQMYCETANRIYRAQVLRQTLYPSTKILIDELNEKSLDLYTKAITLKPGCAHTMFRCAKGFIKLPPPIRDRTVEKRAKELLDMGLRIAPESAFGNHVMAMYYERIKKNWETAIKYLRICEKKKVFGAIVDLLRLEYRSSQPINLVQRLTGLLEIYGEKSRQCQILSQLISYHLFVLSNVEKACMYTNKVMGLNPTCDDMLQHRTICVTYKKPFNLYNVLIDEIKIRLQDEKCPEEKAKFYYKFLNDLSYIGISVPLSKPECLKSEILTAHFNHYKQRRSAAENSSESTPKRRKKNSKIPLHIRNLVQDSYTLHRTDVDQRMNEIFSVCQREFEKLKLNQPIDSPSSGTSSNIEDGDSRNSEESDYDVFRMKIYQKSKENSEQTLRKPCESNEKLILPEPSTVEDRDHNLGGKNVISECHENSDESDEDSFRMKIYNKSKEECGEILESSTNAVNRLVPSLKNLKIGDESMTVEDEALVHGEEVKKAKDNKDSDEDSDDEFRMRVYKSSKENFK